MHAWWSHGWWWFAFSWLNEATNKRSNNVFLLNFSTTGPTCSPICFRLQSQNAATTHDLLLWIIWPFALLTPKILHLQQTALSCHQLSGLSLVNHVRFRISCSLQVFPLENICPSDMTKALSHSNHLQRQFPRFDNYKPNSLWWSGSMRCSRRWLLCKLCSSQESGALFVYGETSFTC
jgi:hypothetical protein